LRSFAAIAANLQTGVIVVGGSAVFRSLDNGTTWDEQPLPADAPGGLAMTGIVLLPSGRFLSIGRPGNGRPPLIPGGFAYMAISDSLGANWVSVPSTLALQQGVVISSEFSPCLFSHNHVTYAGGAAVADASEQISISPDFR